jgi:hypothetical protein
MEMRFPIAEPVSDLGRHEWTSPKQKMNRSSKQDRDLGLRAENRTSVELLTRTDSSSAMATMTENEASKASGAAKRNKPN